MINEVIPAALAGERLDRVVSLITDVSRSAASALVAAGGATVDGVVETSGKVRLREGQSVSVDLAHLPVVSPPSADPTLDVTVVYEDADVIVVDKSPGIVVHPSPGHDSGTLVNGLLARYPEIADVGESFRPGIVHRLDVGTSGLLVVARTSRAHEALVAALAARDVGREYLALVWGHLESSSSVIDAPIGRDPRDPTKMAVTRDGKSARTHVELISRHEAPEVSAVQCTLETGRTHQIRVHLAAIGHPVVGDATYGGARSALRAPRPMLHARRLEFVHPTTGETVVVESAVPDDMAAVLASLDAEE
jgi:23S rRNA pseudouridine1911/1915/1917 synthase